MAETIQVEPVVGAQNPPKPYRANRRRFFLTYSKCGQLTREKVLQHLETFGLISRYLIASENHKDGTPHIHAFIEYEKKQDFKNSRWADVDDVHPNDGGNPKSDFAVARYCAKDGNYITNYWEFDPFALAISAPTYTEGISIIKQKRPREYLIHGDSIERNLKKTKTVPTVSKFKPSDFNMPLQDLSLPLLIYGPTACGKTNFALAHFNNPLLVRHVDDIKKFNPDYDGIVFDDLCTTHWPPNTVIHFLDMDFDAPVHCRYGNATIPAGTKRIFTYNNYNPFFGDNFPQEQIQACMRRYRSVEIKKPLF